MIEIENEYLYDFNFEIINLTFSHSSIITINTVISRSITISE